MKETLKFCPSTFTHHDMTGSASAEDDEIDDNAAIASDSILIAENAKKYAEGTLKDNDLDETCKDDEEDKKENNKVDNEMQV